MENEEAESKDDGAAVEEPVEEVVEVEDEEDDDNDQHLKREEDEYYSFGYDFQFPDRNAMATPLSKNQLQMIDKLMNYSKYEFN